MSKINPKLIDTTEFVKNSNNNSIKDSYSCDYANKYFGGVVLWTNPHPDYEFDAQSISIDLSNYRYIEIYYNRWQGSTLLHHKIYFEENSTIYSQLVYSDYDSGDVRSWNRVLTINNSGIGFNVNQINGATSNYGLIPYKIIGYK